MSTKQIHIEAGTLIVLSGLQGSGKSSLRSRAARPAGSHPAYIDQAWLSADDLRVRLMGALPGMDKHGLFEDVPQSGNTEIFAMLRQMVQLRLRMGFTVVLDACNPTEADRNDWITVAKECGAPYKVLIVDTSLSDCLAANQKRLRRVPEYSIHSYNQPEAEPPKQSSGAGKAVKPTAPAGFARTSSAPFEVISRDDTLVFSWPALKHNRYDVIGDTHGLLDDLLVLLCSAGWVHAEGKLSHPQGRKLLLLGDLVDRGTQSLELVRLMRRAVSDGVAEVIKGNHEAKLVKFYRQFHAKGVSSWGSFANAETGVSFVRAKDGAELIEFLDKLPAYKVHVNDELGLKLLFAHANLLNAFPGITPQEDYLYGQTGFERPDTDAMYQRGYDQGINAWTLFRGHVPQTSDQANVFSLERHPFQKGELVLLRLDGFEESVAAGLSQREAFHANLLTQRCEFDFEAYSEKYRLARSMTGLVTSKLASVQVNEDNTLRVFKYSKDTFFHNRWGESDALVKARGLVLNASGAIVSHPFDKVFNLHENGAGDDMPEDTACIIVDKLNGFLGIISDHPFKPHDLLVHTQGSFSGEFVDYVNAYVPGPVKGQLKKFLSRHNVTLMFEVVHPDDPHIIEYPPSEQGLWLLGVRGKGEGDLAWTEAGVDEAAKEMGLRRPNWGRMTKAELLAQCRNEEGLAKVEGWMVREDSAEQLHLFKLKSPYYLVTKFLGRLSSKRIAHLFGSPKDFKKTIDEEFYALVDALSARLTKEQMLEMPEDKRVAFVRGLVHELI
jgi:predicted kinase